MSILGTIRRRINAHAAKAKSPEVIAEKNRNAAMQEAYTPPTAPRAVAANMRDIPSPGKVQLSTEGINKQFDVARNRANQAEQANLQQSRDALARRQAQLGGGPGGAFIKIEQGAMDQSAQRLASANEGIEAAQSAELLKVKQLEDQLNFQREEGEAGRALSMRGMDIQAALQSRGQDLQTRGQDIEAALQSRGQQMQARDLGMREKAQKFSQTMAGKQMDLAYKQFDHEKFVDDFNMKLASKMANEKDMLETLFGNFSLGNLGGALGGAANGISSPIISTGDGVVGGAKKALGI